MDTKRNHVTHSPAFPVSTAPPIPPMGFHHSRCRLLNTQVARRDRVDIPRRKASTRQPTCTKECRQLARNDRLAPAGKTVESDWCRTDCLAVLAVLVLPRLLGLGWKSSGPDELDSAFGLCQPVSARSATYLKTGGKRHVWLSGNHGGPGGNHYLDGKVVSALTTWGIFISDFDHALTSSDGQVALVSLDTDESRWSIAGNWAIPIGNRLVVGTDANTLTGYAPSTG